MWNVLRPHFGWENLCPVLFFDGIGLMLVMRRAEQPVSFDEVVQADQDYDYYPDIDVEYKPENWGRIGVSIVCLDYGLDALEDIRKRREYLAIKER